ncbi:MAG: hypothetical protein K8Q91_02645 [Candidatus Vogelbacteria bacterium]|nr:hypothetical protein [Candidatus Vogelbacteria bacterium]
MFEIKEGMILRPDCVTLVPPESGLAISSGFAVYRAMGDGSFLDLFGSVGISLEKLCLSGSLIDLFWREQRGLPAGKKVFLFNYEGRPAVDTNSGVAYDFWDDYVWSASGGLYLFTPVVTI